MSSVLSLQIAHALFPWMRSQPSPSSPKEQRCSDLIPSIKIHPAEDREFRSLLIEMKEAPVRRRRSSSSSSSNTLVSNRQSLDSSAAFAHVGLAMMCSR
ncbi:hypothetical protein BKA66DRAFT_470150 [Pyrenochaeta sp. MPI-SDFR-AT-0127]|nr:hypothetical protein BKA66DRAFT_470150 [Pyrenochaeta sp. MPI-SDFR-AT-0127]